MGICKFRKRSELFCYHCEKAVCFDCITEPHHKLAKVTTYVEWLEPRDSVSDKQPAGPVCALSNKPLTEADEVIRFMNLQIYLLEAINEYGSSKPNITALAGFTIPGTKEPMVPPPEEQSKLAQEIREKLSRFPWISELIALQRETEKNNEKITSNPEKSASTPDISVKTTTTRKMISPDDYNPAPTLQTSGIASRKTTGTAGSDYTVDLTQHIRTDDDPEYKYRPKPIRKVFEALGFLSSATISKAQHYQVSGRRGLFVFALLVTLLMVFLMGMSLTEVTLDADKVE